MHAYMQETLGLIPDGCPVSSTVHTTDRLLGQPGKTYTLIIVIFLQSHTMDVYYSYTFI